MKRFIHYLFLIILPIGIATLSIFSLRRIWLITKFQSDSINIEKDEYLYDSNDYNKTYSSFINVTGSIAAGLSILYGFSLTIVYSYKAKVNGSFYSFMIVLPYAIFFLAVTSFLLGLGLKADICGISKCEEVQMFKYKNIVFQNDFITINGRIDSNPGIGFILMGASSGVSLFFIILNSFTLFRFFRSVNYKFGGNRNNNDIESNKKNTELKPKQPPTSQNIVPVNNNINNIEINNSSGEMITVKKLQDDLNHAINILQNIQVQMPTLIEQQQQKNQNIYQTQQLINLLLQQQIQQIIDPQINHFQQQKQQQNLNEHSQNDKILKIQQQIDLLKQQNNNNLSTSPQTSVNVIPVSNATPQDPPPPYSKEPEVAINTNDNENLSIPETRKEEKENERIKSLKIELESQLQNNEEDDNDSEKDNLENITIEIKKDQN